MRTARAPATRTGSTSRRSSPGSTASCRAEEVPGRRAPPRHLDRRGRCLGRSRGARATYAAGSVRNSGTPGAAQERERVSYAAAKKELVLRSGSRRVSTVTPRCFRRSRCSSTGEPAGEVALEAIQGGAAAPVADVAVGPDEVLRRRLDPEAGERLPVDVVQDPGSGFAVKAMD